MIIWKVFQTKTLVSVFKSDRALLVNASDRDPKGENKSPWQGTQSDFHKYCPTWYYESCNKGDSVFFIIYII